MGHTKDPERKHTTVEVTAFLFRSLSAKFGRQAQELGIPKSHHIGHILETMEGRVLLEPGTLQYVERMAKEWSKSRDEAATALVQIGRAQIERR